ncbi:hypothetical protein [Natronorubrum sp. A-ect3]|uniref:hypothetical protein n=1 Tax=Natronorubrum sp. A-ect3 TaxID=3242698 RepID=UPI00359EA422
MNDDEPATGDPLEATRDYLDAWDEDDYDAIVATTHSDGPEEEFIRDIGRGQLEAELRRVDFETHEVELVQEEDDYAETNVIYTRDSIREGEETLEAAVELRQEEGEWKVWEQEEPAEVDYDEYENESSDDHQQNSGGDGSDDGDQEPDEDEEADDRPDDSEESDESDPIIRTLHAGSDENTSFPPMATLHAEIVEFGRYDEVSSFDFQFRRAGENEWRMLTVAFSGAEEPREISASNSRPDVGEEWEYRPVVRFSYEDEISHETYYGDVETFLFTDETTVRSSYEGEETDPDAVDNDNGDEDNEVEEGIEFTSHDRAVVEGEFEDGDVVYASTGFYDGQELYGNTINEDGITFGDDVAAPFEGEVVIEVGEGDGVVENDDEVHIHVNDYGGNDSTAITGLATTEDDYMVAGTTHENPHAEDHLDQFGDEENDNEDDEDSDAGVPATFEVEITDTDSPVTGGEELGVDATIENTGGLHGTTEAVFIVGHDPSREDSETVTLEPGESTDVRLSFTSSEPANTEEFPVVVETETDSDTETAVVEPA